MIFLTKVENRKGYGEGVKSGEGIIQERLYRIRKQRIYDLSSGPHRITEGISKIQVQNSAAVFRKIINFGFY